MLENTKEICFQEREHNRNIVRNNLNLHEMEKNIGKLEGSDIVAQVPMSLKELIIQAIPKSNEDSTKKIYKTQVIVSSPNTKCHAYIVKHNIKSKRRVAPYNHETRRQRKEENFDPITITYTELLPHLFQNWLLTPTPMKPLRPPYPIWYDPNTPCEY